MYTLMKSERAKLGDGIPGFRAYEQKQVAQYADIFDALTACDKANQQNKARHYVMNDSGKELYADSWID
jgi:hypothetical protein